MLRRGVRGAAAVAVLVAGLAFAPAVHAFDVASFDARVVDRDGNLAEQAGDHPYAGITAFEFATDPATGAPQGNVKDIRVDVPAGLIPNPRAIPQCTDTQLEALACPPNTQVGTEELTAYIGSPALRTLDLKLPLYNMTVAPDQVARFAFNPRQGTLGVGNVPVISDALEAILGDLDPVYIIGGVRDTTDFGEFFTISDVATRPQVIRSKLTFWGVPGSIDHLLERGEVCSLVCVGGGQPATAGTIPFLTNPTKCGSALVTHLTVFSHAGERRDVDSTTPDGPQDCQLVPFAPTIELAPETAPRDSPFGLSVNLKVPQTQDPEELGSAHVEDVSVTLPPGMTINPSAANGLQACTDEQLAKGTHDPVTCPAASRIGDVEIVTPLLDGILSGGIYVGQPLPGDRYRLFLVANGHGVTVRLKGSVNPDPVTGQVTTTFVDNPQVPFTNFTLRFRGDALAPLATPLDCGAATASSQISPWSGTPAVAPTASIAVDGCGGSLFAPLLGASTGSPAAGAFTPFSLALAREDGQQYLTGVQASLPPGLLGMLASVEQCADAPAAGGACPAASRIGTATVTAGAGSQPFALSGPAYLTGPYKGAPFGMAVVIRALAGPFDLGTVVVRQQLQVDPEDAHITVVSDPLPQILEGVPPRLRSVRVDVDRDRFMRNPTSCGTKQVGAALSSTAGTGANAAASFSVDACERLAFKPKLSLRLTGRKQLKTGRHPGVRAVATQARDEAGIRSARVSLPLSLALDPDNAKALCSVEGGRQASCPRDSIVGRATAISPILHKPLKGPVYFVQGVRTDPTTGRQIRTLPTLLATLRGEVAINLRAVTAVERNRLVTTFPAVPDAPVSRFELAIKGGKRGILVANRGLCGRTQRAAASFAGHNGKARRFRPRIAAPRKGCPARLRIGKSRWEGRKLHVKGRIAKTARKRVRIIAHCPGGRVSQRIEPRNGRWRATLLVPAACAGVERLKLTVRYPGGGDFAKVSRVRTLRR